MKKTLLLTTVVLSSFAMASKINVYTTPSEKAKSNQYISSKESFKIMNDWVHIKGKNVQGWVKIRDLQKANPSWSYQQSFSTSNQSNQQMQEKIKKDIHEAETTFRSMFNHSQFFNPMDRPIIIINHKDNS